MKIHNIYRVCIAATCLVGLFATLSAYGQGRPATNGRLAKCDLDADFNYDGEILNDDPTDNGTVQVTPPGLIIGCGEVTKFVLRIKPYREDWIGEAAVVLEVAGVNRTRESGEFESLDEELANMGHIKVYADPDRTELLLDSQNPDLRRRVWTSEDRIVPAAFFVEGISVSRTEGDVRLLVRIESRRKAFATFETSYDHNLITVAPERHPKLTDTAVWAGGRECPPVSDKTVLK